MNAAIPGFSGNMNEPYYGVSFLDACNAHDSCYSTNPKKADCDRDFMIGLTAQCDSHTSGSAHNQCMSYVGMYHFAVSEYGDSAYGAAQAAQQCAAWHFDMAINACPK